MNDPIIDYFDKELERREKRLHAAYTNRDFLEFVHGKEWFYQHVYEIHHDYGWPRITGSMFDKETQDAINDPKFHIMGWEVDNDYFKEE